MLFEKWAHADAFVALVEGAGFTVEETDHDFLTVRQGYKIGVVGLVFEGPGTDLQLMLTPFDGEKHNYALNTEAQIIFDRMRQP